MSARSRRSPLVGASVEILGGSQRLNKGKIAPVSLGGGKSTRRNGPLSRRSAAAVEDALEEPPQVDQPIRRRVHETSGALEPGRGISTSPQEMEGMGKKELIQCLQAANEKNDEMQAYAGGLKRNLMNMTNVSRRDQTKLKGLAREIDERDSKIRILESLVAAQKNSLKTANEQAKSSVLAKKAEGEKKKKGFEMSSAAPVQGAQKDDHRVADLEQRLSMAQKNSKNLVNEVKRLKNAEQNVRQELDMVQRVASRIGKEKTELETKIADMEARLREHEQRMQQQEARTAATPEVNVAALEQKHRAEMSMAIAETKQFKQRLVQQSKELQELKQREKQWQLSQIENGSKDAQLEKLALCNHSAKEAAEQALAKLQRMETEAAALRGQLDAQSALTNQLTAEQEQLRAQLQQSQAAHALATEQLSQTSRAQAAQAQQGLGALQGLEHRCTALQGELEATRARVEEEVGAARRAEEKVEGLRAKLRALQAQCVDLGGQNMAANAGVQEALTSLRAELESAREKLKRAAEEARMKGNRVRELEVEAATLAAARESADLQAQASAQDAEESSGAAERAMRKLREDCDERRRQCEQLERRLAEERARAQALQDEQAQARAAQSTSQQRARAASLASEESMHKLEVEHASLHRKLLDAERSAEQLRAQLKETGADGADAKSEVARLRERLAEAEAEVQKLMKKLESAMLGVAPYEEKIARLQEDLEVTRDRVEEETRAGQRAEEQVQELQKKLDALAIGKT